MKSDDLLLILLTCLMRLIIRCPLQSVPPFGAGNNFEPFFSVQGKSRLSVRSVGRASPAAPTWNATAALTRARSRTRATCAASASASPTCSKRTKRSVSGWPAPWFSRLVDLPCLSASLQMPSPLPPPPPAPGPLLSPRPPPRHLWVSARQGDPFLPRALLDTPFPMCRFTRPPPYIIPISQQPSSTSQAHRSLPTITWLSPRSPTCPHPRLFLRASPWITVGTKTAATCITWTHMTRGPELHSTTKLLIRQHQHFALYLIVA